MRKESLFDRHFRRVEEHCKGFQYGEAVAKLHRLRLIPGLTPAQDAIVAQKILHCYVSMLRIPGKRHEFNPQACADELERAHSLKVHAEDLGRYTDDIEDMARIVRPHLRAAASH